MATQPDAPREVPGRALAAAVTWPRAAAVGTVAFLLLVALFFYVPQFLLAGPIGIVRGVRVWLATGWVLLALAGCAWIGWRTSAPAPTRP
jgi:hypothetical protein